MFGRTVFSIGDQTFQTDDLVCAAIVSGRWDALRRQARAALDTEAELASAEDERLEKAVEEAAAKFRYDRDLITAADTEQWLADRDVQVDDWFDVIRRRLLAPANRPRMPLAPPPDLPELTRAVWVSFICEGAAAELATLLARQAVAHEMAAQASPSPPNDDDALAQDLEAVLSYFPELDPDRTRERLLRLDSLASGVGRCRALALTPEAIRREVEHCALDLIRIDCQVLTFDSEPLAREAALCVKDDGLDINEVASEARTELLDAQLYVEDVEPNLRSIFRSAPPAELLGPIPWEGRYALVLVLAKVRASTEDAEVRTRAERHLLDRLLADLEERRISWTLRL